MLCLSLLFPLPVHCDLCQSFTCAPNVLYRKQPMLNRCAVSGARFKPTAARDALRSPPQRPVHPDISMIQKRQNSASSGHNSSRNSVNRTAMAPPWPPQSNQYRWYNVCMQPTRPVQRHSAYCGANWNCLRAGCVTK